MSFAINNYIFIVLEILAVMEEHGLSKDEVLLELDFVPDSEGNIPVYNNPPQFAVRNALEIMKGKSTSTKSKEQLSVFGATDPDFISQVAADVKALFQEAANQNLMCLYRHSNGWTITRISIGHFFSTDAINAVKLAIHDGNFSNLSRHFDDEQIKFIKKFSFEVSTASPLHFIHQRNSPIFFSLFELLKVIMFAPISGISKANTKRSFS